MLSKIIARLNMWRSGMRSAPLRERMYPIRVNGEELSVQHSKFNLNWIEELGIVPEVIVELGAFDGGDAYRFKKRFPNARMITVEADPDRIETVKRALDGSGVEIHNFAACDQDGPVDWFAAQVDGNTNAQGSMYRHTQAYQERFPFVSQADKPIQVDGKRFESFCRDAMVDQIDLLHMDIEGAELAVLRSLGDVRPKLIYLEWRENSFVGHEGGESAAALLDRQGYRMVGDLGDDRLYRHRLA